MPGQADDRKNIRAQIFKEFSLILFATDNRNARFYKLKESGVADSISTKEPVRLDPEDYQLSDEPVVWLGALHASLDEAGRRDLTAIAMHQLSREEGTQHQYSPQIFVFLAKYVNFSQALAAMLQHLRFDELGWFTLLALADFLAHDHEHVQDADLEQAVFKLIETQSRLRNPHIDAAFLRPSEGGLGPEYVSYKRALGATNDIVMRLQEIRKLRLADKLARYARDERRQPTTTDRIDKTTASVRDGNEGEPVPDRPLKFVTVGGECFSFEEKGHMQHPHKDGILYKFHVTDLIKDRGKRLISAFSSGANSELPGYEERIDTICLNAIRRAFDSGILSFDARSETGKYLELNLMEADFLPQKAAAEGQVRRFIKNGAYWLGYKFSSNIDRHFIRFDLPQDLEYLGVDVGTVQRNVWRLQEEGYLRKSEVPGNALAALKLINEFEPEDGVTRRAEGRHGLRTTVGNSRNVFVVHGHEEGMKQSVARFLEKLDLKPVILHEQANKGKTIIDKFESHSAQVDFAVVLLSPDDFGGLKGTDPKPRARQNVILELGYFIGTLGRGRVCALYTGDVELPSDLHGVLWIAYEGAWQMSLAREIHAAGIDVDLNRIL